MFLIALLAGGGWYFTKGPGQGKFGDTLSRVLQSQSNSGQNAPPGYYPNYQSNYPSNYQNQAPQPAPSIPAQYASQQLPVQAPMAGGPTIRVASFNIQVFGDAKVKNQDAALAIAAIIQQFDLVAIQEIRTQDDYFLDNFLRNYVNQNAQNGRVYDKVIGPRLGRSSSKEQYAFVYNTATIEVNSRLIYTVNDPHDLLHREPLVAMFRTRGPPPQQAFTFVLVNIHTDPDETDSELDALGQVYQAVRRTAGGEDDIIVLGDLNVDDRHLGMLGRLEGVKPLIRGMYTNTRQTELYDNIVLHQPSTAEFRGNCGVFNFPELYKLPRDQALQRALQVSDHLPIWAEFSAYEAATPGRVATREEGAVRAQ
jgi:endonuclease/exonuclease/phosphatase family metal-dependent hydrolase